MILSAIRFETVFYIESADYDDVDIVYTVDSETLVLKTIERMNDNDESLSITTFHYGEEVELPERITAWQGALRTVTLQFLDEDATEIYQIPANWEFNVDDYCPWSAAYLDEACTQPYEYYQIPANWEFNVDDYCPWSAAYLDEACTQPYEYPGDGTDFTVYVRNEVE